MQHIYISYAARDTLAALELRWRLQAYKRHHPEITLGTGLFSPQPEDENYLVVICSRRAAADPRVEADIVRFCDQQPVTRIVPYVVNGIPNAREPKNECLPAALRRLGGGELLAANAATLGKQRAVNKIISSVCGIRLDELERRSQKQRTRRITVTVSMVLLFLLYALYSEYSTSSRTEYYREIVYENHVPAGVGRLGFIGRLFVPDHYIFKINHTSVLSVTRVGGPAGYTPADPALAAFYQAIDSPVVHYSYHTDGELDAAVHTQADGTILFVMNYTAGMTAVDLSLLPDGIEPYFLVIDGRQSEFSRCVFTYGDRGELTAVQYFPSSRHHGSS